MKCRYSERAKLEKKKDTVLSVHARFSFIGTLYRPTPNPMKEICNCYCNIRASRRRHIGMNCRLR